MNTEILEKKFSGSRRRGRGDTLAKMFITHKCLLPKNAYRDSWQCLWPAWRRQAWFQLDQLWDNFTLKWRHTFIRGGDTLYSGPFGTGWLCCFYLDAMLSKLLPMFKCSMFGLCETYCLRQMFNSTWWLASVKFTLTLVFNTSWTAFKIFFNLLKPRAPIRERPWNNFNFLSN